MKTIHSQRYNHNEDAELYDNDIKNEENPIRKGYQALHNWIGEKIPDNWDLLDLGCGTGNTALSLKGWNSIVCVDISEKMLNIARKKLVGKENITFRQKDIMAFLYSYYGNIEATVSAYTFHHLEQQEKHSMFKLISENKPKAMIFGDLMFKNRAHEKEMREKYKDLCEEFDDEFYWNVEEDSAALEKLGYTLEVKQFSDLSWGIAATK